MKPLRLLLNSGFTGANAFFALAQARGLFDAAGLQLVFTPGRGAYTAAARLMDEGFDAAYGDVNALVEIAALRPEEPLPVAVFMAHQRAPSCITVARSGAVAQPNQLRGGKLVGHASDVALRTFGAYAQSVGLTADSVHIETSDAPMGDLLCDLLDGGSDGVFGYMTTHTAALAGAGRVAEVVRFLRYRDACSALYGSALMVSRRMVDGHPEAVARLVSVVRAAILAAHAEPEAAIAAVQVSNPQADRAIETERWRGTLLEDIDFRPGSILGDVEPARLAQGIDILARAAGWPRVPRSEDLFTRRFLAPPLA